MADVQELLNQARALGESIAKHPQVRAFLTAQAGVRTDGQAQQLLVDYKKQAEHVRSLEAQQKPIEPADKRKLAEYEQRMASNTALKELMRAQADYVALMNQINRAIEQPLAAGPDSAEAS